MEYEDQEMDHQVQTPSYDSLHNSPRVINSTTPNEPPIITTTPTPMKKAASTATRYRECQKNHAVGIGGLAVDGCGEFMPAGAEGTLDALKCAACKCHRNFHRKETTTTTDSGGAIYFPHHHHHHHPPFYRTRYLHVTPHRPPTPPMLALPSTTLASTPQSRECLMNDVEVGADDMEFGGGGGDGSRKRFRTKFTQEQKEKMLGLAEKLGWRLQKSDEDVVQHLCEEIGVRRHVLKVWMHNNKNTLANNNNNNNNNNKPLLG
ncbi:hypothetical protein ACFE04_021146 [Oxalis oulophora]